MKTIIINGVRCSIGRYGKLVMELPAGMTGKSLEVWLKRHESEAVSLLTEVVEEAESSEGDKRGPG